MDSGTFHLIIVLLGSSLFSEVREQATQAAHYLVLYNSLDQTIPEASEGVANPEASICAYASAFPILHTTGRKIHQAMFCSMIFSNLYDRSCGDEEEVPQLLLLHCGYLRNICTISTPILSTMWTSKSPVTRLSLVHYLSSMMDDARPKSHQDLLQTEPCS